MQLLEFNRQSHKRTKIKTKNAMQDANKEDTDA